eukprot:scaffold7344_cov145-Cylindrotheca_fusiformis.AAC.20
MSPSNEEPMGVSNQGKNSAPLNASLANLSIHQPEVSADKGPGDSPGGLSFQTEGTWEAFGTAEEKKKRKGKTRINKADDAFEAFDASFPPVKFGDDVWGAVLDSARDQSTQDKKDDRIDRSKGSGSTGNFPNSEAKPNPKSDAHVNPSIGIKRIERRSSGDSSCQPTIWKRIPSSSQGSPHIMPTNHLSTSPPAPPSLSRTPSNRGGHRSGRVAMMMGTPRARSTKPMPREATASPRTEPQRSLSSQSPSNRRTTSKRSGQNTSRSRSPPNPESPSLLRGSTERLSKDKTQRRASLEGKPEQSKDKTKRRASLDEKSKASSRNIDNGTERQSVRRSVRRIKSSDLQDFQFAVRDEVRDNSDAHEESNKNGSSKELSNIREASPKAPRRRNVGRAKSTDLTEFQFKTSPQPRSGRIEGSQDPRKRIGGTPSFRLKKHGRDTPDEATSPIRSFRSQISSSETPDRQRDLGRSPSSKLRSHIARSTSTGLPKSSDSVSNNSSVRSQQSDKDSSSRRIAGRKGGAASPVRSFRSQNPSSETSDRQRSLGKSPSSKLRSHIARSASAGLPKSSDSVSNNSSVRSQQSGKGSSNRTAGRRSADSVQSGSSKETNRSNSSKENLGQTTPSARSKSSDLVRIDRRRGVRRRQSMDVDILSSSSSTLLTTDSDERAPAARPRRMRGAPSRRGVTRAKSTDDALELSWGARAVDRDETLDTVRKHRSLRGIGTTSYQASRPKSSKHLRVAGDEGHSSNARSASPIRQHGKGFIASFVGSPAV